MESLDSVFDGWDKCKNKYSDMKEKYKHWVHLSEMSGFGWNESKNRFKANDDMWSKLNSERPTPQLEQ